MHDEATTHYIAMVDQTTCGHKFLSEEFGAIPRIGWQLDPFGHSATQAALLSAETGFDALFFGRIDYQDRTLRQNESRLEFVWNASPSLGSSASVWTSSYYTGNYSPPPGFCWDTKCSEDPIQDDPRINNMTVKDLVDQFVDLVQGIHKFTPG